MRNTARLGINFSGKRSNFPKGCWLLLILDKFIFTFILSNRNLQAYYTCLAGMRQIASAIQNMK
jgi:hypothetical protein